MAQAGFHLPRISTASKILWGPRNRQGAPGVSESRSAFQFCQYCLCEESEPLPSLRAGGGSILGLTSIKMIDPCFLPGAPLRRPVTCPRSHTALSWWNQARRQVPGSSSSFPSPVQGSPGPPWSTRRPVLLGQLSCSAAATDCGGQRGRLLETGLPLETERQDRQEKSQVMKGGAVPTLKYKPSSFALFSTRLQAAWFVGPPSPWVLSLSVCRMGQQDLPQGAAVRTEDDAQKVLRATHIRGHILPDSPWSHL